MSIPFAPSTGAQNAEPYEPIQNAEETAPISDVEDVEDVKKAEDSEKVAEAPIDPLISTLPPEAQGETNGGPLGCCLGTVAGIFLTLLIILSISIAVGNGGYLGWTTGPVALLGALGGGYAGWRIGKSIYREYELSPQRKARLERAQQQWHSGQSRSKRAQHPKIG